MNKNQLKEMYPDLIKYYEEGDCCSNILEARKEIERLRIEKKSLLNTHYGLKENEKYKEIEYYNQICDLTSRLSLVRKYAEDNLLPTIRKEIIDIIDNKVNFIDENNIDYFNKEHNLIHILNTLENILYVLERIEKKLYEED